MKISRERPADAPGGPGYDLYELDAALWDGVLMELFGNTDLGQSPLRRWAESRDDRVTRQELVVVRDAGVPVGLAVLELPQLDNRHVAFVSIAVRPEHRRRGIGAMLFEEARKVAAGQRRCDLQCWTWDRLVEPGPHTIGAAEGDGVVDASAPGAAFLRAQGFRLAQVDVMSGLTLAPQPELEAAAGRARMESPSGYRLIQWRGDTPERWIEDAVRLQVAMSTDIPTGEADLRPEVVDADRIRSGDRTRRQGGLDELVTAIEHTGRLVGFSRVVHDPTRPEVADQWDTLVLRAHRGNGLGWLMKTASHAAMRSTWPQVQRLVTGNASENVWMLAINRRLGYRPIAASGWYTRREPDLGAE